MENIIIIIRRHDRVNILSVDISVNFYIFVYNN